MQRQFTIELRVDFADADKLPVLKNVLKQVARHAYATAQLLTDNPKTTQIAVHSDDFFTGHEEIKLMEDTIQDGLDSVAMSDAAANTDTATVDADAVSAELKAAML